MEKYIDNIDDDVELENGTENWFDVEIASKFINESGRVILFKGPNYSIEIEPDINRNDGFKKDPYIKYRDIKSNKVIRIHTKDAGIDHHYTNGSKSIGKDEISINKSIAKNLQDAANSQCNIGYYKGKSVKDAIDLSIKNFFSISDKEYENIAYDLADFTKYYDRSKESDIASAAKYVPTRAEKEELKNDPKKKEKFEDTLKKEYGKKFKNIESHFKDQGWI